MRLVGGRVLHLWPLVTWTRLFESASQMQVAAILTPMIHGVCETFGGVVVRVDAETRHMVAIVSRKRHLQVDITIHAGADVGNRGTHLSYKQKE